MPRGCRTVVSCEHAVNDVPPEYMALFAGQGELLSSHRGFDPGSLELGRRFARALDCNSHATRVTRLLVDVNRSLGHRTLFSAVSRALASDARQRILQRYYHPHRARVESDVRSALSTARSVLHLGVHTFTPVFDGVVRHVDVGLLYDPRCKRERAFCLSWQHTLQTRIPELRVRRNFPYRGRSDGLTTYLRRRLRTPRYLGIELEVNQRFPNGDRATWLRLQRQLVASLGDVTAHI